MNKNELLDPTTITTKGVSAKPMLGSQSSLYGYRIGRNVKGMDIGKTMFVSSDFDKKAIKKLIENGSINRPSDNFDEAASEWTITANAATIYALAANMSELGCDDES